MLVRLIYGWSRPRRPVPGVEFSGVVEAVGEQVTRFRPGDAVYGMSPDHFGAHAELVCVAETAPLAKKPATLTHAEAVAVLEGASTPLTFLSRVARVQPGQRVLIYGASGAVGSYGVQVARHLGAHVTGVCSHANADFVRSLGAHEVLDYGREDVTQGAHTWDVFFDAVGKLGFRECQGCLSARGIYLSTVPSWSIVRAQLRTLLGRGKRARFVPAGLLQSATTLDALRSLVDAGAIRPTIGHRYELHQVREAHGLVDTGHKRSSAVVAVHEADAR